MGVPVAIAQDRGPSVLLELEASMRNRCACERELSNTALSSVIRE